MSNLVHCVRVLIIQSIFLTTYAFELAEECQWNYTLKHSDLTEAYTVEMKDLGRDCPELYKDIQTHKVQRDRRFFLDVLLTHTTDPGIHRVNVSWKHERQAQEYLLIFKLKRQENDFTLQPNDKRCVYVNVKSSNARLKFPKQHTLFFDCIQIRTGTIGAALDTFLRSRHTRQDICNVNKNKKKKCFDTTPVLYTADIEADCCSKQISQTMLKVMKESECSWILSSRRFGIAVSDYILKGSSGTAVEKGTMLPLEKHNLFIKRFTAERPDIYRVSVSFWCSFVSRNNSADHNCITVDRVLNGSQCNMDSAGPVVGANKSAEPETPYDIIIIMLGCVVVASVITIAVFCLCRRGIFAYCFHPNDTSPRNNEQVRHETENVPTAADNLLTETGNHDLTTDFKETDEMEFNS